MSGEHRAASWRELAAAGAAVAASALLYALAFPPFGWSAVSWVALVPLLRVFERQPPARAALLGVAHGTLISLTTTPWLVITIRDYFGRSLPFATLMLVVFGLVTLGIYHGVAFAALSFLRRGLRRGVWLALIPAAWVVTEYARTRLGLRCPWEKLGDAHAEAERLRQLASLFGVYGVSMLVVLGNVTVAEALGTFRTARSLKDWRRAPALRLAAVFLTCLLGAELYGAHRLATLRAETPGSPAPMHAVLIQGNVAPELRWSRMHAGRVLRRYGRLTRDVLRSEPRPDLIVWPEQALQTPIDDPTYGPPLLGLLRSIGVPVLLGAPTHTSGPEGRRVYNSAYLFRPGHPPLRYDKMRLVPFSETHPFGRRLAESRGDLDPGSYAAGLEPGILDWEGPRLGILICFEATYPEMARALAVRGARVLVNLSNDGWFLGRGGQEQHLGQVVFRAVETGLPVLRATTTGISARIAPDGSLIEQLGRDREGALRAELHPGRPAGTLYVRIGDALCGASAIALALALAVTGLRRRAYAVWEEGIASREGASSGT